MKPLPVQNFLQQDQPYDNTRPKAFLNWMIVDEEFKKVNSSLHTGAKQVPLMDGSQVAVSLIGLNQLTVRRNGWLYVYISNESNQDVYFDDLIINDQRGPVVEQNNYYPFGLEIPGLHSQAIGFGGNAANRIKFNGGNELQSKEFTDGSGLETYDATFRMYDPQIGRFMQQDLLADVSEDWSPYSFANDNPVMLNDPLGLAPDDSKSFPVSGHGPAVVDPLVNNLPVSDPSKALPVNPTPTTLIQTLANTQPDKNLTFGSIVPLSVGGFIKVTAFTDLNFGKVAGEFLGLRYSGGSTTGLSNFNWIQTVNTNNPLDGRPKTQTRYIDNMFEGIISNLPFYYQGVSGYKLSHGEGFTVRFFDDPKRLKTDVGTKWQAELSLVGQNSRGHYLRLATFFYGFQINSMGNPVLQHLAISSNPSQFHLQAIKLAR